MKTELCCLLVALVMGAIGFYGRINVGPDSSRLTTIAGFGMIITAIWVAPIIGWLIANALLKR